MPHKSINFGKETLNRAAKAAGFETDREVYERLGVSQSTWRRWKRTGEIPVEQVTNVVLLLELPQPPSLPAKTPTIAWEIVEVLHAFRPLAERLLRSEAVLGTVPDGDGPA